MVHRLNYGTADRKPGRRRAAGGLRKLRTKPRWIGVLLTGAISAGFLSFMLANSVRRRPWANEVVGIIVCIAATLLLSMVAVRLHRKRSTRVPGDGVPIAICILIALALAGGALWELALSRIQ